MELVSCYLPKPYLNEIERLIIEGHYPNRSEFIRCAVREYIKQEFYHRKAKDLEKLKIELGLMY